MVIIEADFKLKKTPSIREGALSGAENEQTSTKKSFKFIWKILS